MSLQFVTDLGDQAVIVPLAVAMGVVLLLAGWWRGALAWGMAVSATLFAVLVAKMGTIACQGLMPPVGLLSPSGHTASAAVIYGGMLALVLSGHARHGVAGWTAPAACGLAFAVPVGFTRLALAVHTMADVLAGGLIGTVGVVALSRLAGPHPPLRRGWIGIAATVLAVLVLFHGRHVYAEMQIGRLGQQIWPLTLCSTP